MRKKLTRKRIIVMLSVLSALFFSAAYSAEPSFEKYLSGFDYKAREDMKIDSESLVKGLEAGDIQLIDIRFKEEFEAWHMGIAINIPLNELPGRLAELPKDKIIVTACPHKDRSVLAMAFLRTKGFRSKYLADGLVGLAEYLRGEKARDFMNSLSAESKPKVVVYYFHRTVRCSTCEMIEKLTVAAVEAGFAEELKNGTVRLEVLNIEDEPNLHYETEYRLKSQSVIVSERSGASEKRWKNLDKIWEYVDDASLFVEYIQNGVREYLQ